MVAPAGLFGLQPLILNRRRRIYADVHFQETSPGSRVLIPRYIAKPIAPYFTFLAREIEKKAQHDSLRRRPRIFITPPKHVLNLPLSDRVFLVQTEQTHFNPKELSDGLITQLSEQDPAIGEVVEGVRIHGPLDAYGRADKVIDYSRANVNNVLSSKMSHLYEGKAEYFAPLIPDRPVNVAPRPNGQVSTMFGDPAKGRRKIMIDRLSDAGIRPININGQFNYDRAFGETSILINVSQVPYFQTPEELRILPALLQRVIVISEDIPALESLDYRRLIQVAPFWEITQVAEDTLRDYNKIWSTLFGSIRGQDSLLNKEINRLVESNHLSLLRLMD